MSNINIINSNFVLNISYGIKMGHENLLFFWKILHLTRSINYSTFLIILDRRINKYDRLTLLKFKSDILIIGFEYNKTLNQDERIHYCKNQTKKYIQSQNLSLSKKSSLRSLKFIHVEDDEIRSEAPTCQISD